MEGRASNRWLQFSLKSLFQRDSSKSNDRNVDSSFKFEVLKWIGIFIIIPPILNFAALQREEQDMKSERFDIGFSQNMYMNCSGEGLPTVIFDSPIGMSSDVWIPILNQLNKITKVCIYDRAGLGRSDMPKILNVSDPGELIVSKVAGAPFSSVRMVHDLHRLITYSFPQKQPFILVGAEVGAINMLMYSKIHNEQVSGLVLINPMTNSMFDTIGKDNSWQEFRDSTIIPWIRMLKLGALAGLNRLAVLSGILRPFKGFEHLIPSEVLRREKHHLCNPSRLEAALEEYLNLQQSTNQLDTTLNTAPKRSKSIDDITVMTGNYYDELYPPFLNQAWSRSAQDIVSRVPGCQHLVINGANRSMIYTHTLEIISPIRRMIKKFRKVTEKVILEPKQFSE
uniref:AB hydrolase-1 domain-containing protein n=2 Tax=Lepeophtheirus salmonis TaxID=72036 RepID=A0A0K2TPP4_LEPSM